MPNPEKQSGKLLIECENVIKKNKDTIIIRPAGIFSTENHPAKYLSGKKTKINPHKTLNLVDIDDLVSVIVNSLGYDYHLINVVNKNHPTKGEFYSRYCKKHGLVSPQFNSEVSTGDKLVKTKYKEFEIITNLF